MVRYLVLALGLLLSTPALAIDFSKPIIGLDGKAVVDEKTKQPITLGVVSTQALVSSYPDEKIDGVEKLKRGQLALKILDSKGDVTLTAEEVALLKNVIAKGFGPLVVSRAWPMLDGGVTPPSTPSTGKTP